MSWVFLENGLPSGNQTWQWENGDVDGKINEHHLYMADLIISTFDYRRVFFFLHTGNGMGNIHEWPQLWRYDWDIMRIYNGYGDME